MAGSCPKFVRDSEIPWLGVGNLAQPPFRHDPGDGEIFAMGAHSAESHEPQWDRRSFFVVCWDGPSAREIS
jgi:hypothetical protein